MIVNLSDAKVVINEQAREIKRLRKATGWRSVENSEPNNGDFILTWGSHSVPWQCEYRDNRFHDIDGDDELSGITHWQPLPAKPDL